MEKKYLMVPVILLALLITKNVTAQQGIVRSWEGLLDVGMGNKLRVVLHITQTDEGVLAATLDSPDQKAKGIKIDSVILKESSIKIVISSVGGNYEGRANQDFSQIDGEWKQNGRTFPLILKPVAGKIKDNLEYISIWQGKLKIGDTELKSVLRFFKVGKDSVGAFLDSPDQGARDISASKVFYGNDSVFVEIKRIGGYYSGKFNSEKNKIDGNWNQAGRSFPLLLEKIENFTEIRRPQEPYKPYPYYEEEVTFENKEAGIKLAGTFTYPKQGSNFPAVVLVSGSGPQNRDEEVFNHKPFLIWSDYLTKNGIAVLRYDDRGIAKSTGNFGSATTLDFVTDAIAAVNYLKSRKEIDGKKIGIAGHSEGGVIAPIAANKCNDVSFIVLGAGTSVPGEEIISLQVESILKLSGVPEQQIRQECDLNKKTFEIIRDYQDSIEAAIKINTLYDEYYASLPDSEKSKPENSIISIEQRKKAFMSRWMRYFLTYDPRTELIKLNIPVLALFGEKDIQVDPAQNKDEMENALRKSKSKNYKVVVFPGLNHVFQECKTGAITEYAQIEQTTSPKMLELMTGWIKEVTK